MRKFVAAAAAAAMLSTASPAGAETVTMEMQITRGNSTGREAPVVPDASGDWTFVADVSGKVNEVMLQLYLEGSRGECTGTLVGEHHLGGQATSWNKRHVEPGRYTRTIHSDSTATHCARVLLWGSPGATVSVAVTSPASPANPLDGLLP